ncbi:chloramphenicol-biosynthetic FADH2-dependent halogenase CmlS [Pseudomonas citri]|uniref:chloramphenicol-biosynthetic FADH2-dependent halogenase CmlS n=1 Tax=Pseudomonas citri TaxID=2978349 RepID=UPI0021B5F85A|nr:chloramphenicol-biosynthetic FADH2-dependent halogenase CmlS [Pseudomonas citri]
MSKKANVIVMGGGPAGSIAALTLQKLGHQVTVFEKEKFPRYRVGESFLPGTLSILHRLGLSDKIAEAGYVLKPSATFLWGKTEAPWTFSFSTPKTEDWVFDHAIQVLRSEFDQMLLDTCRERGVRVFEEAAVIDVDVEHDDFVSVQVRHKNETSEFKADYLIDASGSNSPLVRKLDLREYDEFYKSVALWSYFKTPDPFKNDLNGTTFSITFEDGWIWMIPLKDGIYSVGTIVDQSKLPDIKAQGLEAFYDATLAKSERALGILNGVQRCEEVKLVRDWSYETKYFSNKRFFLCGDSACFTDPLFSQGVHLASQSAVSAASSIDYLMNQPEQQAQVHAWYNRSYKETYNQYHEFLASFYTFASFTEPESEFWTKRRISESADERLKRKEWFEQLVNGEKQNRPQIGDFKDRASTMIAIGRHQRPTLTDEFMDAELNPARVRWISDLTKQLNRITRFEWKGERVETSDYFKIEPQSFKLQLKQILSNGAGKDMSKYSVNDALVQLMQALKQEGFGYKELMVRLNDVGEVNSSQFVIRLMESGLLDGYDKTGERVRVQDRLRFDGVGVEYEV